MVFSPIIIIVLSCLVLSHSYRINRLTSRSKFLLHSEKSNDSIAQMDVGEFEHVKFDQISAVDNLISKYRITGTIKPKDTNQYMNDYKEEIKKRGVVFPGFRAGKLPPYVMQDVRRYIVCFGLESLIGQLCNLNSLMACSESGEEVAFGSDPYYEEIITPRNGKSFEQQRDTWKEGTDFNFEAIFFAKTDIEEELEEKNISNSSTKVLDTEIVE